MEGALLVGERCDLLLFYLIVGELHQSAIDRGFSTFRIAHLLGIFLPL